jgi:uncharacterized protein (TIGR00730 family)
MTGPSSPGPPTPGDLPETDLADGPVDGDEPRDDRHRALPRYRTGSDELDAAIADLVAFSGADRNRDLVFEMVVSALRMQREDVGRRDLKIANYTLKEMRYAFHVFSGYREVRKLSIFGSARIGRDKPAYAVARDLAAAVVERGWMVMTGAGPGIMEAGNEGAGREHSFGVNIQLPFEQSANPAIDGDPKLINFRYFFTRKLTFVKESDAFCLLPGGFGTMDESFEVLTLLQTGKAYPMPVVLLDAPGGTYWPNWRRFVEDELAANGLINEVDLCLVHITDDVADAVAHVEAFYRNYHSMRYVGRRLVLRHLHALTDDQVAELASEFGDIVVSGTIERADASPAEVADDDVVDLPRLALRFDQTGHARLRQLIDRLNGMAPEPS